MMFCPCWCQSLTELDETVHAHPEIIDPFKQSISIDTADLGLYIPLYT